MSCGFNSDDSWLIKADNLHFCLCFNHPAWPISLMALLLQWAPGNNVVSPGTLTWYLLPRKQGKALPSATSLAGLWTSIFDSLSLLPSSFCLVSVWPLGTLKKQQRGVLTPGCMVPRRNLVTTTYGAYIHMSWHTAHPLLCCLPHELWSIAKCC